MKNLDQFFNFDNNFKDTFGNFSGNSDIYLNYQSTRQLNSNCPVELAHLNNENNFENFSKTNIANENHFNRLQVNQFSDNVLGVTSSLYHAPSQSNFNHLNNNFDNNFNQISNDQFYENYDNFKSVQQFSENDWKQIHALNYLTDSVSTQHILDNMQYKNNQQYFQYEHSEFKQTLQSNSPLFDKSLNLIKEDKVKRKVKKSRVLFSQWQINELEKLFKKQKYVTANEREIISKRLRLNPNQVKIWFQNRRYKIKKKTN